MPDNPFLAQFWLMQIALQEVGEVYFQSSFSVGSLARLLADLRKVAEVVAD
jgi:hypothetical protein